MEGLKQATGLLDTKFLVTLYQFLYWLLIAFVAGVVLGAGFAIVGLLIGFY